MRIKLLNNKMVEIQNGKAFLDGKELTITTAGAWLDGKLLNLCHADLEKLYTAVNNIEAVQVDFNEDGTISEDFKDLAYLFAGMNITKLFKELGTQFSFEEAQEIQQNGQ